jgi:hypothetical protein
MTKYPWPPEANPNPSVGELVSILAPTEQLALLLDELNARLEDDTLAEDDFTELLEMDERELELQAMPLGNARLLLESLFDAFTASVSVE